MNFYLAHVNDVKTPTNRLRKEFDVKKANELRESIRTVGLIQMPVCRLSVDGSPIIVAGERRLRAIRALSTEDPPKDYLFLGERIAAGLFPYILTSGLDPIQLREVELEENIRRSDLTWQERCQAVNELHEMRRAANPNWTEKDTLAELVGEPDRGNVTTVVKDEIRLANNLHRPEVAKAGSKSEAMKILSREMEMEFTEALGQIAQSKHTEHSLLEGDCRTILANYPSKSFDIIIMDPPYGIDAHKFGDEEKAVHHTYDDSPQATSILMSEVFPHLTRVAADQCHLYMFCDIRHFLAWSSMLELKLWRVWPKPIIWDKGNGHLPEPSYGPRYTYECILFANKGRKPVAGVYPDIIRFPLVRDSSHAAEKPTGVYVDLINRSKTMGSLLLDPFCGSGTVFEAGAVSGLKAVGIELDPFAIGLSKERLSRLSK